MRAGIGVRNREPGDPDVAGAGEVGDDAGKALARSPEAQPAREATREERGAGHRLERGVLDRALADERGERALPRDRQPAAEPPLREIGAEVADREPSGVTARVKDAFSPR